MLFLESILSLIPIIFELILNIKSILFIFYYDIKVLFWLKKKLKKKDISKHKIKNTRVYHLSNSDNFVTPHVIILVNGESYRMWTRSIKTTLCVKTKLVSIAGIIKKSSTQYKEYHDWDNANSMATTCLINVTKLNLYNNISHPLTIQDVWIDLEEHFAQISAPQIHQLWRNLCLIQK